MLKARLSNGMIILGLDQENIRRLTNGEPINAKLEDIGGKDDVIIMYGSTTVDILTQLEKAMGQPLPLPDKVMQ